jgi:hypothetical protein
LRGDWVVPGVDLDAVAKKKNLCPRVESNPDRQARSLITILTWLALPLRNSVLDEDEWSDSRYREGVLRAVLVKIIVPTLLLGIEPGLARRCKKYQQQILKDKPRLIPSKYLVLFVSLVNDTVSVT